MDCPTECGRKVETNKLLCITCWRKVPKDLQDKVNAAWRTYVHAGPGLRPEQMERRRNARHAYQEVRDAAIAEASTA